jgi:hypothetical protein
MDINWSRAVDLFKHQRVWYYAAQKLPIESYKDIILLYEFAHHLQSQLIHDNPHKHISQIIQQFHRIFRTKDYTHDLY